ncbi:uncharacterized protein L203_100360 [Cryptococcus depauperatus CBS 7841]|uniref:Uncharacterized protein n=1 Tax=Cryptococcus depauperatus CBS 7841 TaxID=1295531 RepID=A0AAJ8LX08_9TREE
MLAFRPSRRSASCLSRSIFLSVTEPTSPYAESSSAPSQRGFSSFQAFRYPQSTSVINGRNGPSLLRKSPKGNTRLRNEIIANARRLAKALKDDAGPSSTEIPLGSESPTDSSSWDDLLKTSPSPILSSPTLEDLLSKRPSKSPPVPWAKKYQKLYKHLYNSIDSAFLTKQIRKFAQDLDLDVSSKTKKTAIIKTVMDSWEWYPPIEGPPQKPLPKTQVFDLPPSELFLVLHDPTFLSYFQTKGSLYFSILRSAEVRNTLTPFERIPDGDENRMVLVARGQDENLQAFRNVLNERKQIIKTVNLSSTEVLGLEASVGLLQTVSNTSGAYVEFTPDKAYHISAMSSVSLDIAQRLLTMAALQLTLPSPSLHIVSPRLVHFTSSLPRVNEQNFSLLPFVPSSTGFFPWQVAANALSQGFFRLSKIKAWSDTPEIRAIEQGVENVEESMVVCPESKRDTLKNVVEKFIPGKKTIISRFGHLLFPVQPKEKATSFDSPLPGQWPLETAQKWLVQDRKVIWAPARIPEHVQYPLLGPPKSIRRIQYRQQDSMNHEQKVAKFAYTQHMWQENFAKLVDELEKSVQISDKLPGVPMDTVKDMTKEDTVEMMGNNATGEAIELKEKEESTRRDEGKQEKDTKDDWITELTSEIGTVKEADFFLPDRPTDFRIISTSFQSLPGPPPEVKAFFEAYINSDLKSSLPPPAAITIDGEKLLLELDEYVEEFNKEREDVVVRSVKVQELKGKTLQYSEIECLVDNGIPSGFWRELASVTRDIVPRTESKTGS